MRNNMSNTRNRRAAAGLFSLVIAVGMLMGAAVPAQAVGADGYPTWDEVQQAKANTAAAKQEVNRIAGLITGLENQVAQTQAELEQRGLEFEEASNRFDDAQQRYAELQQQADDSAAEAKTASDQAGKLAGQLYRSGSTGITTTLLFGGSNSGSGDLLSDISSMSRLMEHNTGIYDKARTASNTAASLAEQADSAKAERERLRVEAEDAKDRAMRAAQAAETALAQQQTQLETLRAQKAALEDTEAATVAGYQEGVAERKRKAEEEARRKAEEARKAAEAARKAAEQAAQSGQPGTGSVQASGWALPIHGWISSSYGPRSCNGCASFHQGTDIAAPLGTVIHAASAGIVTYRGPKGTYGNLVIITHADGYETYYAHTGSYLVAYGEHVVAGQPIARVGMTGLTTGPHLHFETRRNGISFNAVPFMAARGVYLGT